MTLLPQRTAQTKMSHFRITEPTCQLTVRMAQEVFLILLMLSNILFVFTLKFYVQNARFSVLWLAIFSFLHFEDKVLSELLCIYIFPKTKKDLVVLTRQCLLRYSRFKELI